MGDFIIHMEIAEQDSSQHWKHLVDIKPLFCFKNNLKIIANVKQACNLEYHAELQNSQTICKKPDKTNVHNPFWIRSPLGRKVIWLTTQTLKNSLEKP